MLGGVPKDLNLPNSRVWWCPSDRINTPHQCGHHHQQLFIVSISFCYLGQHRSVSRIEDVGFLQAGCHKSSFTKIRTPITSAFQPLTHQRSRFSMPFTPIFMRPFGRSFSGRTNPEIITIRTVQLRPSMALRIPTIPISVATSTPALI